jgi:hypothetical protein
MSPNEIHTQLQALAQQYSTADRRQRRKLLTRLLSLLQKSNLLWRGDGVNADAYASAYQTVMVKLPGQLEEYDFERISFVTWFNQQLVTEIITQSPKVWRGGSTDFELYQEAKQIAMEELLNKFEKYDSSKGTVIHWFNNILKWRIKDLYKKQSKEISRTVSLDNIFDDSDTLINEAVDTTQIPETLVRGRELLEQIRQWVEKTHPKLQKCCLQDRPEINCITLILKRLPREIEGTNEFTSSPSWKEISEELQAPVRNIRRCFHRRCLPLLKNQFPIEEYALG